MSRPGRLATALASGFGAGYAPAAPGTAGALIGVVMGAALLAGSGPLAAGTGALVASLVGLWAVGVAAPGTADPSWVVIDEIAGQMLALTGLLRLSGLGLATAFVLFRLLDIAKPGPIGWADRRHGPAAIMGDDIMAGAIAAGILWAARTRWPHLFG